MGEENTAFSREAIEWQIQYYLLLQADGDMSNIQAPERKLVGDLQRYYAPVDHRAALQRVWHRFLAEQQATRQQSIQPSLAQNRIIHLARRRKYRWLQTHIISFMQAKIAPYLGISAIIAAIVLALGGLGYVVVVRRDR